MKNETFTFGSEPFNEWLATHPDVEKLTIEGKIHCYELEKFDKFLFKSKIKELEIGDVELLDKNNNSLLCEDMLIRPDDDYEYCFSIRLFKMLCNKHFSSIYTLSKKLISSPDGKVLVHISDKEIIHIPHCVEIIGDCVCIDYEVYQVFFKEGLKHIGKLAFSNCDNLYEIALPNTVETLDYGSFYGCYLEELTLSSNLKEIPDECFAFNHLTKLSFPNSIKAIRHSAFFGNPIDKIEFKKGLEIIEGNAFSDLCYVMFPATMKEIAVDFYYEDCITKPDENVPYIEVRKTNPFFEAKNGNLYKKGSDELYLEAPFRCQTKHFTIIHKKLIPLNTKPKSVILKWNPSFSSYPMSGFIQLIYGFAKKDYYECGDHMDWSVWDYDKIKVGDRVYWVKVGYGQIGIVGSGVVTSEPYKSEDWSGKGRITYYVDFIPNVLLNPDTVPILTCEELQRAIPDFEWSKGHSGLVLNDDQAQNLDTLWKDFLLRNEAIFKEKMQKEYNEQVYIKKYSDDERKTDI